MKILNINESILVQSGLEVESSEQLEKDFKSFLQQPIEYRNRYLQKNASGGLQGYSYMGQTDSKNQYPTDLLHSFVLSDAYGFSFFPNEFQDFCNNHWERLTTKIKNLEKKLLQELGFGSLCALYDEHISYLLSCNYYPAMGEVSDGQTSRLSAHEDISLFTTFVFGSRKGFSYSNEEVFLPLDSELEIVIFPGYFLETITKEKIKALKHRVELKDMLQERFSFAFFSIPAPKKNFFDFGLSITSEEYYDNYLSLF
ncbi:MAG: 2OG-Fe(II) oxygenase family protein [Cruoricaptor ignavus]|nr:2OG-Fe(II) oxygenase family protein [Cruoricaptor ignavus]